MFGLDLVEKQQIVELLSCIYYREILALERKNLGIVYVYGYVLVKNICDLERNIVGIVYDCSNIFMIVYYSSKVSGMLVGCRYCWLFVDQ